MASILIDVICEQADFGFTGKTNILDKSTNQFLGAVYQIDGSIIKCMYKGEESLKALYRALYDSLISNSLKYVSEPEIVEKSAMEFSLTREELVKKFQSYLKDYQDGQRLKPPAGLRLAINPDFFIKGEKISSNEYDIFKLLTEYSKVSDIYANSKGLETEVTLALVALRKKGAIRVVANS